MGPITSLAINISDNILYSASLDKTVKVWSISDLKCIENIPAHSEPINAIVVADDGILYTASDDPTIRVWKRNFSRGEWPHSLMVTLPAKCSPVKTQMGECYMEGVPIATYITGSRAGCQANCNMVALSKVTLMQ